MLLCNHDVIKVNEACVEFNPICNQLRLKKGWTVFPQ